jgi:chromosome segregation ATPase
MKLPVSREKYEIVIQERDDALNQLAALVADNERLTAQLESLQNSDVEQRVSDLLSENQRLTDELAQAATLAQERTDEIAGLNTSLDQSNTRITDLEQTVKRLNQEGVVPPARATSQSDSAGDPSTSLNEYMRQNEDDTMACIQRLKEEGF